jgi:hypothetical protein
LIPAERAVVSHYPFRDAVRLCRATCTFQQFTRQMYFFEDNAGLDCRHESHPFDQFNVKKGFVRMAFSCRRTVQWISGKIERKDGALWSTLNRMHTAVRVIEKVGDRVHFELSLVFPEPGRYRGTVFLDGLPAVRFHPYAICGTDRLPYPPVLAERFAGTVLAPEKALSEAPEGTAVVRLRLPRVFDVCQVRMTTVERPTFTSLTPQTEADHCVKTAAVPDPEDTNTITLVVSIAFPSAGLQEVSLYLMERKEWSLALVLYFEVRLPKTDSVPDPPV